MDIEELKLNPNHYEDGAWVGNIPQFGDVKLKVRGLRSKVYREALDAEMRKVPRKLRAPNGEPFLSERLRITADLMSKVVLLDWSGIASKGKPLPFDRNLAQEWCTNPAYIQFAESVAYAAQLVDAGSGQDEEEILGNSKPA